MSEFGLVLLLVGVALLVAEAHVAGVVLGVFGGIELAGGAALAIGGAGAGVALVVAAVVAGPRAPRPAARAAVAGPARGCASGCACPAPSP